MTESSTHYPASEIARSDAQLVKACLDGDQDGWDALVARYQRLVYAIPRRAGLSDEQAADVFQEVFLTLLQKIGEIEQPDKIRSWIVTTAKFKTWAVVRGEKWVRTNLSEEELEAEFSLIPDTSPLADAQLIELEQQHLIRTAIEKLDERCRTILTMIYLRADAASYAEVASAIGTGETSISPMRARCLKKIEKLLLS